MKETGKVRALRRMTAAVSCLILLAVTVPLGACVPEAERKAPPVYYSEFGAKGDGVTDDFEAIIKTHEYANENGKRVCADEGGKYYIGAHTKTAVIKTDVEWNGAEFIIDDSEVTTKNRGHNIFEVQSDYKSYEVELPENYSLKKGQSEVNLQFETPVMLYLVNDNKKDYIRYGNNQNSGSSRQEIILVDENGVVDEDTPILWDYTEVTRMTAYSVSDKAITISGGIFTTIVNKEPVSTGYYARGINVKRSNTTLFQLEHYLTGEPKEGSGESSAPYTGFYAVNSANNVTIRNCILTGHTVYSHQKPTGWVQQGTYDTTASRANKISWIGCTQSNSITDTAFWGVMSSNFCKNLLMEDCNLSRFDAHQGVYNATIKNTVLGRNFNIIGAGTLLVENVERLSGDNFLWLRSDYGSTWNGDMIFRNCRAKGADNYSILGAGWTDWDFGYACYLPANLTIDHFVLEGKETCYVYPSSIANLDAEKVKKSKNPYAGTQTLTVQNEETEILLAPDTGKFFAETKVVKG